MSGVGFQAIAARQAFWLHCGIGSDPKHAFTYQMAHPDAGEDPNPSLLHHAVACWVQAVKLSIAGKFTQSEPGSPPPPPHPLSGPHMRASDVAETPPSTPPSAGGCVVTVQEAKITTSAQIFIAYPFLMGTPGAPSIEIGDSGDRSIPPG